MDAAAANAQHRTSDDVNDILKRKRKVREHKACYPCRKRKVRCDSNVPCKTCVDRNHADLCTFNPPSARRDSNASQDDHAHFAPRPRLSIQQDDWDRVNSKLVQMERALSDLKDDIRLISGGPHPPLSASTNGFHSSVKPEHGDHSSPEASTSARERSAPPPNGPSFTKAMEMNEHNQLTGDPVHIGGGSIPALINALGKGGEHSKKFKQVFGGSGMLPFFGLENESVTYPFISLWGYTEASTRISELRKGLPSDAECLETFRQYRDGAHITYPAIPSIDAFENDLVSFLSSRRINDSQMRNATTNDSMDGFSVKWIGLLFAVFASGAQFSPIPKRDRDLLSQVYACCSFECLRLVNFLSNASVEVVQTLLVLGNTLSNGMNAGAAWVLLGLTLRLARTLGCHSASERPQTTAQDIVASKIWWAMLWQDSFLSLSYDRATSTATPDNAFPPSESPNRGLTFYECMYRIAKIGLLTVRNRVALQTIESRLDRCVDLRADIARTREQAVAHLRDVRKCRSTREQCEYWALHLHASYMTSELCRPAISPGTSDFDKGGSLRRQCITHLLNTVEAFTGLAGASPVHSRSWHVVQRALSAALLLGILGEPLRNNRAHDTLRRLVAVIRDNAGGPMAGQEAPSAEELPAPILRSISAINKLCAPETITPRNLDEPAGAPPPSSSSAAAAPDFGTAAGLPATPGGAFGGVSTAPDDALGVAGGPNLDFDESAFFLPTPLAGFEDESSPYALMDSILWGGNRGAV